MSAGKLVVAGAASVFLSIQALQATGTIFSPTIKKYGTFFTELIARRKSSD